MAAALGELIRSRRLWPLTLAQSCGALNDNLVKNAMIVLAIFRLGIGGTGLSALAGALFIAPYILLSATAGKLADRLSKPRLVVVYKAMEVALMTAAAAAFLFASVPALLAVLVGLGVQAALFGPVKYGVLPEYLAGGELLAGNGVIEATTFVSIVCGSVAGGGLILLDSGPAVVGAAGIVLSLIGLFGALRMPVLPAADPGAASGVEHRRGRPGGWSRAARAVRPIWLSVLGLSWFWVMGATLMIEFPVVVRDTMQAGGSVLTLLLAVFAIGVGIGSLGCTRLLHGQVSARLDARRGGGDIAVLLGFCRRGVRARMAWPRPRRCWRRRQGGGCCWTCCCWRFAAGCSRCRSTPSSSRRRRPRSGRA